MTRAILAVLCLFLFAINPARAHHVRHHHRHHRHLHIAPDIIAGRTADCYGIPWCGCYLRHLMGVADRAYNVARNWAHYGQATSPHVGTLTGKAWCVWRWIRKAGQWLLTGAAV